MKRLKRFLEPRAPALTEACEFCSEPLPKQHSHVVHLESRRICCSCRPCYLLFSGNGTGRYRAVPDRPRRLTGFRLSPEAWAGLDIPVGVAFFFRHSRLDQTMAFYPSPAGATESRLDLSAWDDLVQENPVLQEMIPDVEALLVRKDREGFRCYLVPVSACYELVGRIRLNWSGLTGGEEVREEIRAFFADLEERVKEPAS